MTENSSGSARTPSNHPVQSTWPLHQNAGYRESTDYAWYDDLDGARKTLEQSSERLFNPGPQIDVEICEIHEQGVHPKYFETEDSLSQWISETSSRKQSKGCICTLNQGYSWGPVLLSLKSAGQILSHFDVFPEFLNVLNAFGRKESGVDEAFSAFYSNIRFQTAGNAIEFSFLLKHVEPGGNPKHRNPYSLRHFGVYQRFDFAQNRNHCVIIKPSEGIGRRLRNALKPKEAANRLISHWTYLPMLCLSAATDKWKTYINFTDEKFNEIVDRVRFSTIEAKEGDKHDNRVTFKDLQIILFWMDQLLLASHVLKMNMDVIDALAEFADQAEEVDTEPDSSRKAAQYKLFKSSLRKSKLSHKFYKQMVDVLYKRAEKVATMLRDIVSLIDSNVMKDLGKSTNDGGGIMLQLSMLATKEAKTMKVLTVVALVFLPANFVATWLGMGYLSVKNVNHGVIQLRAEPEMWIFVFLTVPLMVVTIGGWYLLDLQSQRALMPGVETYQKEKKLP